MSSLPFRICLIALAPVVLGGCSSLFGGRFSAFTPGQQLTGVQIKQGKRTSIASTAATEAGRTFLANSQPGEAIEAFQRALASGEPVAPALNGLGVAYARIGRVDLAERYFRQATATEPQNTKFAQNLDLLLRLTKSIGPEQVRGVTPSQDAENPSSRSMQAGAMNSNSSQRIARSEIRIVTRAVPASAGRNRVSLVSRFQPLARIEFAQVPIAGVTERRIDVAASFKSNIRVNLEKARR